MFQEVAQKVAILPPKKIRNWPLLDLLWLTVLLYVRRTKKLDPFFPLLYSNISEYTLWTKYLFSLWKKALGFYLTFWLQIPSAFFLIFQVSSNRGKILCASEHGGKNRKWGKNSLGEKNVDKVVEKKERIILWHFGTAALGRITPADIADTTTKEYWRSPPRGRM